MKFTCSTPDPETSVSQGEKAYHSFSFWVTVVTKANKPQVVKEG
jgi:hypothetical protein